MEKEVIGFLLLFLTSQRTCRQDQQVLVHVGRVIADVPQICPGSVQHGHAPNLALGVVGEVILQHHLHGYNDQGTLEPFHSALDAGLILLKATLPKAGGDAAEDTRRERGETGLEETSKHGG